MAKTKLHRSPITHVRSPWSNFPDRWFQLTLPGCMVIIPAMAYIIGQLTSSTTGWWMTVTLCDLLIIWLAFCLFIIWPLWRPMIPSLDPANTEAYRTTKPSD